MEHYKAGVCSIMNLLILLFKTLKLFKWELMGPSCNSS
jgi:hypothetical protein